MTFSSPRKIRYDDRGTVTQIVGRYLQNPKTHTSYFVAAAKRSRDGSTWNLLVERCDPAEVVEPIPIYWLKRKRPLHHYTPVR